MPDEAEIQESACGRLWVMDDIEKDAADGERGYGVAQGDGKDPGNAMGEFGAEIRDDEKAHDQ